MTNILASASEALPILDHASSQTDRWVWMALLLIILAGCALVVRYLIVSNAEVHGKLFQVIDDKYKENARLVDDTNKTNGAVAAAIDRMSQTIDRKIPDAR